MFDLSPSASLPNDIVAYRNGYPNQADCLEASRNRAFYSNALPCRPDGLLIQELHSLWRGNYAVLEEHHGYIQWLFPIREHGVNSFAQPLQQHEAIFLQTDPEARERLLTSYKLMLDFYGMRLDSYATGKVVRADNYRERYINLSHNPHNNLRISRILKCLGETGLEHLQLGLCLHLAWELRQIRSLFTNMMARSAVQYWFPTLRDPTHRSILVAACNAVYVSD